MRYVFLMSTKSTVIIIFIVLVATVGAYFIYRSMRSSSSAPESGQSSLPTDQVQGQDVKVGMGVEAKPGDTISVLYEGRFSDGTVFDSSAMHGNQPLTFVLGSPGLIPGFQIGVNGMKEGGERLLSIPPTLGYGSEDVKEADGKVIIPANSTLVFSIQLVKVVPAPAGETAQ